ncbi:hypothetical protein P4679_34740 [Priestia megaterium]|uniref:hypothetical protein n=1 Tax=Priestia megaterium TaxID=1404 RepID=UPI002E2363B4|nr:hypothetical protein [Priestia megaterium]
MKNEVRKVDFLTEQEAGVYNLTKEQAMSRLKEAGVSESEQMLNRWCRDQEIDAVRIAKGAPKNRGIRIASDSLEAFIQTKSGNAIELLNRIKELEEQLQAMENNYKAAKLEIKQLKDSGIQKKKERAYNMHDFVIQADDVVVFKMNSPYKGTFKVTIDPEKNAVTDVEKRGNRNVWRQEYNPFADEEFKKAVIAKRNEHMEQQKTNA